MSLQFTLSNLSRKHVNSMKPCVCVGGRGSPELMSLEDTELIDILVQNRKTRPKRRKGGKQRGLGGAGGKERE